MYSTKYGKTIKLFLIDAEPDGRMACELSNWNGKELKSVEESEISKANKSMQPATNVSAD